MSFLVVLNLGLWPCHTLYILKKYATKASLPELMSEHSTCIHCILCMYSGVEERDTRAEHTKRVYVVFENIINTKMESENIWRRGE